MEDPEKNSINTYGIANLFEHLSALYLQLGNASFATTCLLQSIIETPVRVTDIDVYNATDYELHSSIYHKRLVNEVSFALLYFGLTHEMGHTYADDCLQTFTKIHSRETTDEAIKEAIIKSAKSAFEEIDPNSDYMFNCWMKDYLLTEKDKTFTLHCENLRSEIFADNLGYNILITSLAAFTRHYKQKFNFKTFVCEVIIGLFTVQLMEACKYLVKTLSIEQSNVKLASRYFPIDVDDMALKAQLNAQQVIIDFQISHAVRWEYLKPSFGSAAVMHLFPDTWSVKNGTLFPNCSPIELKRREEIAMNNIENYLSFYTKEMKKLQFQLGSVSGFIGHLVTETNPKINDSKKDNKNFTQHIRNNFKTYINLLSDEKASKRRIEVYNQLSEYKILLRSRGKDNEIALIDEMLERFK
jgi:hypothetical protein